LKSPVVYHGTHKPAAHFIRVEGIKTSEELNKNSPFDSKMSYKTDPRYTYFFKDEKDAQTWASVVAHTIGFPPEVVAVDIPEEDLERDYEMLFGEAYRKKGGVPKERIIK